MLADSAKGPSVWAASARKMGPQALRRNLNTLLRHDEFYVVDRSVDPTSARLTDGAVNDNMVNYIAEPQSRVSL